MHLQGICNDSGPNVFIEADSIGLMPAIPKPGALWD